MSNYSYKEKNKILIVDDVAKNIQLVANFLTQEGYEVNFALEGNKAIEHAKRDDFDLILLDVMMPSVDGFEVCRKLKENRETESIPVIFVTAKTDEESIARGFEVGGVDYIIKPFNPPELLARVRTHINLKIREEELKNLNHTKDTFLSIIGHDVKTPVANMVSLSELIISSEDSIDKDQLYELLNDIVESGRQGIWLLENLLSWTRIQTGKMSYDPQMIMLNDVVSSNINFIQQVADRKSIIVAAYCQSDIELYSDINILNTILRNLLSNAIKFTKVGGDVTILAIRESDNIIVLSVEDTGIGIEQSRLETLFDGIGQKSTAGTQNEKGSGLGLSLIKDLCDMIGAEIEVESLLRHGTKFTIKFNVSKNN